jgi:hypothetical protein
MWREMADDDDQDTMVDDPQDQDDDTDTDGDDWTPPKTKAEFDALVAKAGNPEAAKWRRRATGKDPNWKPNGTPADDKSKPPAKAKEGDPVDADAIRAAARAELQGEYEVQAAKDNLRAEVSLALMTAGLNISEQAMASPSEARKAVSKVVNLMDIDNMVLEDGKVEGLDDEIAKLRKDYPGLFKASAGGSVKPRTRGGDAAPRRNGAPQDDDDVKALARAWFSGS